MKNEFMPDNFEVTAEELHESLKKKKDPLLLFDLRFKMFTEMDTLQVQFMQSVMPRQKRPSCQRFPKA